MTPPLLQARGLHVGYPIPGGLLGRPHLLPVVQDITFTLQAGQVLGIVGESGCGKSTLGRALLGLIPASAGQVLWQGQDLATMNAAALRRGRAAVQIIFQDPVAALDPRMTVARSVSRPLATFEPGLSRAAQHDRAVQALRLVGLAPEFAARYPHELSGGQAQRVGIARAIIGGPGVIVCDEPVSALDVSIQAQVVNLLMDLRDRLGLALVFISHNLAVVRQISSDVMVMCLGRAVETAPAPAFYAAPRHPYSRALMSAVPEPDPVTERARLGTSLPGEMPSILHPPPGCVFATRCPRAQPLCHDMRPHLTADGPRPVACHFPEPS